jgi:hypothetical protein
MAMGPRCFRCLMLMLSGPEELLLVALRMASKVCVLVMVIVVEDKDLVCLSILRLSLLVVCLTVFTNCLLKEFAFCWEVMAGLLLKEIALLGCGGGFLLDFCGFLLDDPLPLYE